ncbi:glycosyltransferase [Microvirga yunnanensis]|uniref:glycosyltransferase n=1 Tax=Microvirga yunnanensis TaxID=2953740 RepID=UPI0021C5B4BC|nr:glycosyltransferase family 2 protein [Microvirga sp. HBU65207]
MKLQHDGFGIFVVDNCSPDDSVVRIQDWAKNGLANGNSHREKTGLHPLEFRMADSDPDGTDAPIFHSTSSMPSITLIKAERNRGFAAGNNIALRKALQAGYQSFWLLNNDTEVLPDTLDWMLSRIQEDARIGMCGSTLVYADHPEIVQNLGGGGFLRLKGRGYGLGQGIPASQRVDRSAVERELRFVSGASMLVTREFLESVGLMEESYFLYWEEMDWAARSSGRFRLGYAPQSIVFHKVGASIGTSDFGESSPLSDYYMTRNRIRFCIRFSKVSLPFVVLDVGRAIGRQLLRGRWSRAKLLAGAAIGFPYTHKGV